MVFNYLSDPSIDRMIVPSYFSQYVTFLSEPAVRIWYSSLFRRACLNAVDSKRHNNRVWDLRSQMIHEPSPLADTAWELSLLIWMDHTLLRCSLREVYMTWVCFDNFHILIYPSAPPEIILVPSEVAVTAVHPWLWASLMTKSNFPDWGRKALIFPSLQPDMIDFPSCIKNTL